MLATTAVKRITRDVNSVTGTNSKMLAAQGIFYEPNEANIQHGTAMLIGQSETPYFGGFYFFSIEFPPDYPFSPLRVQSLTQDGLTRFNPNLYLNGKVCLSILNTWGAPEWSGIQTLESVLLVLMSAVLNSNPLENEPAYNRCGQSSDAVAYQRILWHANLQTAVYKMLTAPPAFAASFLETMAEEFEKRRDAILVRATASVASDGEIDTCRVFSLRTTYDFKSIVKKIDSYKK